VLKIRSISLTDFGPFKGDQHIEFPGDDGVSIVYGENMRGKTTLLNAIRFALFGKIISRGNTQAELHQIGNWETVKEKGKYGFKVVLDFEHEGAKFQLTRECKPRSGVTMPQTDFDYQQDVYLMRDGSVLGPDERNSELARIMPEAVSRFFLFDGELLQQYEELLRNESEMGHNIKEAIERILGVPILTNGRADLGQLFQDAQKREAKAAQKNQKTQALGNQHEALLQQRDELQKETVRLKGDLEKLRAGKSAKEEMLRKSEKTKSLLDERSRLQDEITNLETQIAEKEEKKKALLTVAWRGLLVSRILATREGLEQALKDAREVHQRSVIAADVMEKIRKALDEGKCSTCGQGLSVDARSHLGALVTESLSKEERGNIEARIQELESRIAALKQSEAASNEDVIREVQNTIGNLKVKKATAEDRLTEIKDQTKDLDETAVRRLFSEYEKTITDMSILQEGIKKQDEAFKAINDNIAKVETEMAKFADADLDEERARKELCDKLKNLFAEAVDLYRGRLRTKVERDATDIFLKLTTEPEYKALKINDSYGLTILHEDGSEIPVRSAGAEHIVALSLMGALQRNAPLRGPLVMDSPFGRLDDKHTKKVVQALPSMADQVMLLVYDSELNPAQARNDLKGLLRKEYRITRKSARHSELETMA
jgi:DNA sulfur modification protein DndD